MTLNQITIYYSKALHSSYTHSYNRIDFQVDVTKVMKILEVDAGIYIFWCMNTVVLQQ